MVADDEVILELALLAGAIPAILHCIFLPTDTRGNTQGMWFLWSFLTIFLLSYMLNDYGWEDLVNLFNVLFLFLIGILIASAIDSSLIARIAGIYAILMSPYLLWINLTGEYVWGRLHAGSQPNTWGLIALNVAIGAFALRNRLLQAACLAVVLMTIYNAQSRGSMVALVPVLFIFGYQWYVHERNVSISWKLLVTYLLVFAAFSAIAFYSDVIIDDILRLNDPRRGLQSGATGRDKAWAEAISLWFNAPLFGVGFRKHENLMVLSEISAHNAYLAMLADTGFVGFLAYMIFLGASFFSAMRATPDPKFRLFLVCVITAYAVTGMFERRAINAGNSFSITFIFVCLTAMRLAQERLRYDRETAGPPLMAPARQ
ncbi:MAG: O-antigen ligase family protein [Rhodospirillales bacterium]